MDLTQYCTRTLSLVLVRKSLFFRRPHPRPDRPFSSLPKVLDLLRQDSYCAQLLPEDALHKTMFLITLATRLRGSQFHALIHHHNSNNFATGFSQVSLTPALTHLAKNMREEHSLQPVPIPAWIEAVQPHPLCLVWALHTYMSLTPKAHKDYLLVWADSLKWCTATHIVCIQKRVINLADPGKLPREQVRKVAGRLAFL